MSVDITALESATKSIGRKIFSLIRENRSTIFQTKYWQEQILEWCMSDRDLRNQLLRFVDVYPSLQTTKAVAQHIVEYFPDPDHRLPKALRLGTAFARGTFLSRTLVAQQTKFLVHQMAKHFIAATTTDQAIQVLKKLNRQGAKATIDILGEAVLSEEEAGQYIDNYLKLVEALGSVFNTSEKLPGINVSLKLSSLYSQFDPLDHDRCLHILVERLSSILRKARTVGAFVNIDAEQYDYRSLTFDVFKKTLEQEEFREYDQLGIVMQGYVKDAEEYLQEFLQWVRAQDRQVTIRLVKGAYWDYEIITARQRNWPISVFMNKWETDLMFEKLVTILLENHAYVRTAVASHNIRSIAHTIALTDHLQVPADRYEFQLLYGMADHIQNALQQLHYVPRIYLPFGELIPGMAYLVRRILENTANESFLRIQETHSESVEQQLMSPEETGAEETLTEIHQSDNFRNEPVSDFSYPWVRDDMQHAIADVKEQLGKTYYPVINHEIIQTPGTFQSTNPGRITEVVGVLGKAEIQHADLAVSVAEQALSAWSRTPVEQRVTVLRKAADLLRRRRYELTAWEIFETGKPWREADADICEAIDFIMYYTEEMKRLAAPQLTDDIPGEINLYSYRPRGVGVIIAPWNFPLAILCGMTTAAVITGNSVVMKPAEQSSVVAAHFMSALQEAGIPKGVVNYLPGYGEEVGAYLVRHPGITFINFTGSRDVGLTINEIAAQTGSQPFVKKVVTEMGGKNATIIDDSADLDEAIHGVLNAAFGYQGQKCSACSRVIVLASIYDHFVNRFVTCAGSLTVGSSEEPGTIIGPVIDAEAKSRIRQFIEQGKKEAVPVLETDVSHLEQEGHYIGPTVFMDVPPDAEIAQEEIFGPVVAIIRAQTINEAIAIANGTRYALTGGIFSRTPSHIEKVKQELEVGNVYINRSITGSVVRRQPFGGFKLSGIGSKAGGPDYLLQFLIPQTVTDNIVRHGFAPLE